MSDSFSSFKNKLHYLDFLASKNDRKVERKKKSFVLPEPWEKTGEFTYKKITHIVNPVVVTDYSGCTFVPPGSSSGDLLFFDLETTGLSGGAGNLCFLLGTGIIYKDILEIQQVFLSDFPGEPEFLRFISPFFQGNHVYVSYNGKSFDSHLIKSRFLLNKMVCTIDKQCDLLHISRRFFGRVIGSCSLGDIEEDVLCIRRENDIAGYEVPDIYFDFLRTGDTDNILRVFDHNYQDIVSLACLFNVLLNLITQSGQNLPENIDSGALGQYFLETGNQCGITFLETAYSNGDVRSGKYLSIYYKKKNEWEKAIQIWKKMSRNSRSLFATLELAKYYEHREKDYGKALEYVDMIFDFFLPLPAPERRELFKRKRRIQRKIERRVEKNMSKKKVSGES